MPGVEVTNAFLGGLPQEDITRSSQVFMVGLAERGDTEAPILVTNMYDVNRFFGGPVNWSPLWDQLALYFAEGGSNAWVQRITGASPTKGTLTLQDRQGTPDDTLKADAANAGAWSSNLKVWVRAGAAPDTFRITVFLNDETVDDAQNITSITDAVNRFAKSIYVRFTDLASSGSGVAAFPAIMASPTALSAGDDKHGDAVAADYVAGLTKFGKDLQDGAVCIPGQTGTTIWDALIAHAEEYNRLALLAGTRGDSISTLATAAAAMTSEYAGLFAPYVIVSDGDLGTKALSPEGYVAACRSRAHRAAGPWVIPAGEIATSDSIIDLDQIFLDADISAGDVQKLSLIRKVQGDIRLYGWRSLAIDQVNYPYLKERDLLNRIAVRCSNLLEDFVYDTIDARGRILGHVQGVLEGYLSRLAKDGALFPMRRTSWDGERSHQVDPGYLVNVGADINPPELLLSGTLTAQIFVRTAPTASTIKLTITKVGFAQPLPTVD